MNPGEDAALVDQGLKNKWGWIEESGVELYKWFRPSSLVG